MADTTRRQTARDHPRPTPELTASGSQNGQRLEDRTTAYLIWEEMSFEERLGYILRDGNSEAWYDDLYLQVLARFRTQPAIWGRTIAVWQDMRRRPSDLEAAVDAYIGIRLPAADTQPFPAPESATALLAKAFPPLHCFVAEILTEGLTILAGKPKKGKSYLALDMSLSIAVGRQAFRHFATEQARVLYVSLEDGERRLQRRLRAMQPNLTSVDGLDFLYSFPRLGAGAFEALQHYAQRYRVIIIDVLGRILPEQTSTRKSLSEYQEITDVLGPIQQFALGQRMAIVLIDHLRKASVDDDGDGIIGSQGKFGVADHGLIYGRKGEEKDGILKVISRDLEEEKFVLTLTNGHLEYLGKGEIYELDSEQNKIIKILEEEDHPLSIPDIMKALGIAVEAHYKRFRMVMSRLYNEDRVGRTKKGLYTLYGHDRADRWEY